MPLVTPWSAGCDGGVESATVAGGADDDDVDAGAGRVEAEGGERERLRFLLCARSSSVAAPEVDAAAGSGETAAVDCATELCAGA